MPLALRRACAHPGCRELVERGWRWCAVHRTARAPLPCRAPSCAGFATFRGLCADHARAARARTDARRPSAAGRGYGSSWRQVRAAFLSAHPTCARCGRPAEDVHHLRPLRAGGTHEATNLEALCHGCHSRATLAEARP